MMLPKKRLQLAMSHLFGDKSEQILPVLTKSLKELPEWCAIQLSDLLEWLKSRNADSASIELCRLLERRGLATAIDQLCTGRAAILQDSLASIREWFKDVYESKREFLTDLNNWKALPPDLQVLAMKWLADQANVFNLLECLDDPEPGVRWWAAYHIAHIDFRRTLLKSDAVEKGTAREKEGYGKGVRAQVFEVIVRQALAGAPWQEICQGPMAVNKISAYEVYHEVLRRNNKAPGFNITMRHVAEPRQPLPQLDEKEYESLWLKIRQISYEGLSWSNLCAENWQAPEFVEASKVLLNSASQTVSVDSLEHLAETMQNWAEVFVSTGTDKTAAETTLLKWYRSWCQPEPGRIIWCASPLEGMLLALEKLRASLTTAAVLQLLQLQKLEETWAGSPGINMPVRFQPFSLCKPVLNPFWSRRGFSYRLTNPWDSAWRNQTRMNPIGFMQQFERRMRLSGLLVNELILLGGGQVSNDTFPVFQAHSLATLAMQLGFSGQFDAAILFSPRYIHFGEPGLEFFEVLADAARSCGFWWPFRDTLIISEKPTAVHVDDNIRWHNGAGPAIEYGDGLRFYYINGIAVPEKVVIKPETITLQEIEHETNVERRRILTERFGLERFIKDSGADVIDQNELGILYRKQIQDDEPLVMVRVPNSTPEPDGSFKEYFLRVPPDTVSVRAAIAWTFSLDENEYSPVFES